MLGVTPISEMWIARDMAGTGLYTLWVGPKPIIDNKGYYCTDDCASPSAQNSKGSLLMTIHESKWPWGELKLDRGSCNRIYLVHAHEEKKQTVIEG